MVLKGRKAWIVCPPSAIPHDTDGHSNEKMSWNHITHPQLPWQCAVLGPGDVIIVPSNWWHLVRSTAASVAVTRFVPDFLQHRPSTMPKTIKHGRKGTGRPRYSV